MSELANRLDVTKRTIQNHIDAAEQKEGIFSRKVGNSKLYWYDGDLGHKTHPTIIGEEPDDSYWYTPWEKRGYWLGARRQLTHEIGQQPSVRRRVRWIATLEDFASEFSSFGRVDLQVLHYGLDPFENEDGDVDRPSREVMYAYIADEYGIPEEKARYHFTEYPFFETREYGKVTGIAEFYTEYLQSLYGELRDDQWELRDWEDVETSKVAGYVPDAAELLTVGDAIDTIYADLFNVRF